MNAAQLVGIAKSYGEVKANDGVDLTIRAGTVHALVGENGAGKSTAMKILFGMVSPDAGKILFGVREVHAHWDPHRAGAAGVGMVHQHFMLAGPETVLDNLVLGAEDCRFGVRRRARERAALEKLMGETGLRVPLDVPVESLPVGLQSRCEILKVLYRKARFLILDEPTAVLTPSETADLLRTLRGLRDSGHTVLIVTHKLKEVMEAADEATVLRAGKTVATRKISETSIEELSELMVGRRIVMPKAHASGVHASDSEQKRKHEIVAISFGSGEIVIRPGEITGIAGVEGNGQEKIVERLIARMKPNPKSFAFIPADRHHEGLVLPFTLTENLRLTRRFHPAVPGMRLFQGASESERALLAEYDVRPPKPELAAEALSGGNQQKLIVARELSFLAGSSKGKVVLAVHPTRGVDVGAIEFIHSRLLTAAESGAAVLLISSELDELMALSHRIGALYRGNVTAWFDGPKYDERKIGLAMLGGANA